MHKIPMGQSQILELVGTKAFEGFVRELEKEGVGVATTKTPPKPGVPVYPRKDRIHLDIEIPRTTASFLREYRRIGDLNPTALPPLASEADLSPKLQELITLKHGTVDVTVHSEELVFSGEEMPPVESLISALTNRVMRRASLTGCFPLLYPKVRLYVTDRCFGGETVDVDDPVVRRALNNGALLDTIAALIARRIGELTAERKEIKMVGNPYRLSQTEEFIWRRHRTAANRTIFNVVACYNEFEASFAHFLDSAKDVECFAKLAEHFTGFHVQYLKSSGALGVYYPDFVVVQRTKGGPAYWIIETKGREDVEVAAKDKQMDRWCQDVSKETGHSWKYLKVMQPTFERTDFSTLEDLARRVSADQQ